MAIIQLEIGDICEVEDNEASGWNPQSVDELIVEIVGYNTSSGDLYLVECQSTGRTGTIHKDYLHFKS